MAYPAQPPEERRTKPRRGVALPAALETDGMRLEGSTVNISEAGVLLQLQGKLRVTVEINHQLHTGYLVRAFQVSDDTVQCAVELDGVLDMPSENVPG